MTHRDLTRYNHAIDVSKNTEPGQAPGFLRCGVVQWSARLVHGQEVVGSNPTAATSLLLLLNNSFFFNIFNTMSKQRSGKLYEQRIAEKVGGRHVERTSYGQTAPDIKHPQLVGECKLRKELAVETWLRQVEEHAEPDKVCVVFAKQKHLDDDKTIVCLRLGDFLQLLKDKARGW